MEDKRFPALRRMVYDNETEVDFIKKCVCVLQNQVDDLIEKVATLETTLNNALSDSPTEETTVEETNSRRVNLQTEA